MQQRVGFFVIDFRHLHRFAAERVRMSTALRVAQPILLVDVTVPLQELRDSSEDADRR
jgi:hypothetical protein